MRPTLYAALATLFVALLPLTPCHAQTADARLQQAQSLLAQGQYDKAYKLYQQVSHGGSCPNCILGMARARLLQGRFADAWKESARLIATHPAAAVAAGAYEMQATSDDYSAGKTPGAPQLQRAEQEYRQALRFAPDHALVRMRLALVLFREHRLSEGKAQIKAYLASKPPAEEERRARLFLANPALIDEEFAPDFVASLTNGGRFRLLEQHGRMVLLCFWLSANRPAVSAMQTLASVIAAERGKKLTVVGVCGDRSEGDCRHFIARYHLTWPQIVDTRRFLFALFRVHSFPSYVLIDGDEIIRDHFDGAVWLNDFSPYYETPPGTASAGPQELEKAIEEDMQPAVL